MLYRHAGAPTIAKDGVSVAKEIELEGAVENMGAQMVKSTKLLILQVMGLLPY